MYYATIKKYDIANGPGVRVSLFVSGCTHHCKNCFNSEAWDFKYGNEYTEEVEQEILDALSKSYIQGLSLLGGEPFELVNQEGILPLVKKVRKLFPEKTIWAYSGYLFDKDFLPLSKKNNITRELLENIDVLVDGKFVEELKSPKLLFRGSSNQRIIDVIQSLKEGKVVIHEKQLNEKL